MGFYRAIDKSRYQPNIGSFLIVQETLWILIRNALMWCFFSTAKLNWNINIFRELDKEIIGFRMTKLAVHFGKPADMNVLSNSYPVSLMDKKLRRLFNHRIIGSTLSRFIAFLCDLKTYVSQYDPHGLTRR